MVFIIVMNKLLGAIESLVSRLVKCPSDRACAVVTRAISSVLALFMLSCLPSCSFHHDCALLGNFQWYKMVLAASLVFIEEESVSKVGYGKAMAVMSDCAICSEKRTIEAAPLGKGCRFM